MQQNPQELIEKLFDFAFNNPKNEKKIIDLGIIDADLAKKIKEQTDLDLKDYVISVDNFGIRHTMEKHGNPNTEIPRSQIAITKEDFSKITAIVLQADQISIDGTTSIGKEVILFEKRLEELYTVAKEVRTITSTKKGKVSRLMLQSFWKRK